MKTARTKKLVGVLLAIGHPIGCLLTVDKWGKAPIGQEISCIKNLKQIGIASRTWAGDHDDKFPFNVSTNGEGTLELCSKDAAGFDNSAHLHFKCNIKGSVL